MNDVRIDLSTRPLIVAGSVDVLFPESGEGGLVAQWIQERRDDIGLIYFHNQSPSDFQALLNDRDLPRPDAVISDEGASVQLGGRMQHVGDIEEALVSNWPGRAAIREALPDDLPLKPMRGGGAHCLKLAYTSSNRDIIDRVEEAVHPLGARVRECGDHIEIVPKGRNPATALLGVLPMLGLSTRRAKSRLLVFPKTKLQSRMLYLGFRTVVTRNSGEIARQRALTAPKALLVKTESGRGFFSGLKHHFGWERQVRLQARAA